VWVSAHPESRSVNLESSVCSVEAYSVGYFSAGMAYNPDSALPPTDGCLGRVDLRRGGRLVDPLTARWRLVRPVVPDGFA